MILPACFLTVFSVLPSSAAVVPAGQRHPGARGRVRGGRLRRRRRRMPEQAERQREAGGGGFGQRGAGVGDAGVHRRVQLLGQGTSAPGVRHLPPEPLPQWGGLRGHTERIQVQTTGTRR